MQRDYEVTFIMTANLDEEASTATVERVNQLITAGGGSVTEVHAWGRRRLAYPIQHQRDGFYVTTRFAMPTLALDAFENDLRLNEGILRHLTVRQDEVPIRPIVPPATMTGAAQGAAATATRSTGSDLDDGDLDDSDLDESLDLDVVPAAEE